MDVGGSKGHVGLTTMLNKDKTKYPQFGWDLSNIKSPPPKKKQRCAHIVQAHNQAR